MLISSMNLINKYFSDKSDKGGNPYKDHLIYVMNHVDTTEEKVVGLLHDIIEDTSVTEGQLLQYGIPKKLVDTIVILTKRSDETYDKYIKRIIESKNQIAINVKLADLENNMDFSRLKIITSKDLVRKTKYKKAYAELIQYKKPL